MLTVRSLFGPVTVEATRDEEGNVTGYAVRAPDEVAGTVIVLVDGQRLETDLKATAKKGTSVRDSKTFSGKRSADGPDDLSISVCVVAEKQRVDR